MSKSKAITYAELTEFLAHLGYAADAKQSGEGYTVFQHPHRALPVVLQNFKPRTAIRPIYLVGINRTLKESAPAEAQEFEAWLDSRMARGIVAYRCVRARFIEF
jgi:hypothetical protein